MRLSRDTSLSSQNKAWPRTRDIEETIAGGEHLLSRVEESTRALRRVSWPAIRRSFDTTSSAGQALLFGLRLWAAVCLALYVSFCLELDKAYWAGTSAAVVSLPALGASLRKATFRMIGTVVGAVAIVALTAWFPQDRAAFIVGLALWGAACGFAGTILQNFASYGAAMAGVTAAVIALDELGATGGPNGDAFTFAMTRATEICIGIVCATIVAAGTDFGNARHRLSEQIVTLASEISTGLIGTFALGSSELMKTRALRHSLTRRVVDLGSLIDEAIGESSDLRYRRHMLLDAIDGLYAALAGWRTSATDLEVNSSDQGRREATIVLETLPLELRSAAKREDATTWLASVSHAGRKLLASVRALVGLQGWTASLQLLSDSTAEALLGLRRALDGLVLLADPAQVTSRSSDRRPFVPDFLPALINSARVFLTVIAVSLLWIATGWPGGATAVTFALVTVSVLSPRGDRAYAGALAFLLGTGVSAILAAIINFAVLPGTESFFGFCAAIGLVLIPIGAMELWNAPIFGSMATYFLPNLAPANPANYDLGQFYNTALGILVGVGAGVLSFLLLPAPSAAVRARWLLALTLRDLRRLAMSRLRSTPRNWKNRMYNRLSSLPDQVSLLQNARLDAGFAVGTEIIRLSSLLHRLGIGLSLEGVLRALVRGNSIGAIDCLAGVDRAVGEPTTTGADASAKLRARASVRIISDALTEHADYFDGSTFV